MNSSWKEVKLVDYYTISSGLSIGASEFGEGFPFLSFKEVFNNFFVPDKLTQLVKSNEKERINCSIKKGDVFLTRTSETIEELGMSCVALKDYEEATFNGFTKRLRPKNTKDIDPSYIGFYLRSPQFRAEITAYSSLITRASLNNGNIQRLRILLPPLTTQCKIASILSAYDDLIENNLKRIKLLEELAQRTYEEWFVKFRMKGEELKVDKETGLPRGWERKPLSSIVEVVSGFPFKSNDFIQNGKFKIVTIKNVQDGYFVPSTTDSINEIPQNVKDSQKLITGDILMSLTGNVGRVCLVFGEKYLLNQRVAKIIALQKEAKPYLYSFLRSKDTLATLENLSNGAAQQNLSPINMANMQVVIPSAKVIIEFHKLFHSTLDLTCNLYLQNAALKEVRDILLPRLMSGEIEV